jgi:cytochrome c553
MKLYTLKSHFKSLTVASGFLLCISFAGCNDKSEEKSLTQNTSDTAPKIEVSHNENAKEIKVHSKEQDANQSKSYYYDYNIKSEYDVNAQPANENASVRTKPRTAVEANVNVRSPYENVQVSMLVNKLSKNFILKCSACHNDYANGIIGPSLLTKDADYIFNKIMQYKSGEKTNVLMNDLIKMMSDEEIKSLAQEINSFNKQIKEMRN